MEAFAPRIPRIMGIHSSSDKARVMVERIAFDPNVLLGKPAIRDTRISVEHILGRMADGWSVEQILKAYPNLQTADVLAALAFTAELVRQRNFSAFC